MFGSLSHDLPELALVDSHGAASTCVCVTLLLVAQVERDMHCFEMARFRAGKRGN